MATFRWSQKSCSGHVDNSSYPAIKVDIDLTLTTPANATGPVPVMMEFGLSREIDGNDWPGVFPRRLRQARNPAGSNRYWPRGWGYAELIPTSYQADNGAGLNTGHHRPGEQGPAAQAGRLGRAEGVGVGREPRDRLF